MASEFAAAALLATVADIGWFSEFHTDHFLKIRTFGVATTALAAELAKLMLAGTTDI